MYLLKGVILNTQLFGTKKSYGQFFIRRQPYNKEYLCSPFMYEYNFLPRYSTQYIVF